MMGSDRGEYPPTESMARLRERVAALQESIPLIRQNIAEQFATIRAHYDQRLGEQFQQFDRQLRALDEKVMGQLRALDEKVSALSEEVGDLKALMAARPVSPHDTRLWWAFITVGLVVAGFTVVLIALWMQIGSIRGI